MSYQNLERVKDFEFFNRNNFYLSRIRNKYRYTNKILHKCRVGCCGFFPILAGSYINYYSNCCGGPFKFPKLNLGFFYSCIILPKLNLGFFLQLFQLNQLLSAVLPINSITTVSRWESSLLAGPDVRFRYYLNHLLQTHKLYLIL